MKKDMIILVGIFIGFLIALFLLSKFGIFGLQRLEIIGGKQCIRIDYGTTYGDWFRCTGADICAVATYIDNCNPTYAQASGCRLEGPLKDKNLNYVGTQTRCCDGSLGCRLPPYDWSYILTGEEVTTSNDCYLAGCYYCGSACRQASTVSAIQWVKYDCTCPEGWLDEYRCNPYNLDQVDRKYQYSDCSTEWRFWKNCNDNNYCTDWSWSCADEDTRKGTRTCYDYTCSDGTCIVDHSYTDTKYEDCAAGEVCENGVCKPAAAPSGAINLIFVGALSLVGIGLLAILLIPK